MRLELRVQPLLLASWKTDRECVERACTAVRARLEPAAIDGDFLVSLVALRYAGGRLGRASVPPFSQLNLRTYVSYEGEPAVFFLRAYVTPPGLGGAFFGVPYRPARLRFREGSAEAPGLGLSIRYRLDGRGEPGELGRHELGLFEAAGLRGFRIRRGTADWQRAVPVEEPKADVLLALGFDVVGSASLFYAGRASFETDVPPRLIASTRRFGSSR